MRTPSLDRWALLAAALVLIALPFTVSGYVLYVVNLLMVFVVLALGMHIVIGESGQFALAHAAFFGIGIYTAGIINTAWHPPFVLSILAGGALSAVLYEVNNTFGERHSYLIPAPEGSGRAAMLRQACAKQFYVSPFMDMDLSYAFRILRPDARVMVAVDVSDAEGLLLSASFVGERRPLSDRTLLRAWLGHPWMTLGVLAAIHVEALKMWLKGEKIRVRPPLPERAVTVAPQAKLAA